MALVPSFLLHLVLWLLSTPLALSYKKQNIIWKQILGVFNASLASTLMLAKAFLVVT